MGTGFQIRDKAASTMRNVARRSFLPQLQTLQLAFGAPVFEQLHEGDRAAAVGAVLAAADERAALAVLGERLALVVVVAGRARLEELLRSCARGR